METKRELRKSILAIRDALTQEEREKAGVLMTERLLGHQWFYGSEAILCFASCGSEIPTWELMEETLKKGKMLFLPKVEDGDMQFFQVAALSELREGFHGIMEPQGNTRPFSLQDLPAEKCLMVMPGTAFDIYGNRLGYGGGFYDRFLAANETLQLRTIAIGYACQRVKRIPADDMDIRPYQIILT